MNAVVDIVDELAGGPPGCEAVTLTLERVVYEDDQDMLTQTADAKRYWAEKRAAKRKERGSEKEKRRERATAKKRKGRGVSSSRATSS